MVDYQVIDNVWLFLIIITNILYICRKAVLKRNGYKIELLYTPTERRQMKEIIEKTINKRNKLFYESINHGIPITFGGAIFLCIIARIIESGLLK
jgi:hypothetical protein